MNRRNFLLSGSVLLGSMFVSTPMFAQSKTLVVGGKDFTEQLILASLSAQLLAAKGYNVDRKDGMGSAVVRQAMENGQVDIYWEYTGTSLLQYNKIKETLPPEEVYKRVKELDEKKGIVWLNPSEANNTFVFVMTKARAKELNIESMSDLANAVKGGNTLRFACDPEFTQRPDGLKLVHSTYNFDFGRPNIKVMSSGLVYDAVKQGHVDAALAFATDGRIPAYDLLGLKDDLHIFPSYALAPCVTRSALEANPDLIDLFNAVSAKLDTDSMAALNAEVDVNKKSVDATAKDFLTKNGFI